MQQIHIIQQLLARQSPQNIIKIDINNQQQQSPLIDFKLPFVIKRNNHIERNKSFSQHTTSQIKKATIIQPQHLTEQDNANDVIIPSLKYTKQQNIQILNQLDIQFNNFKQSLYIIYYILFRNSFNNKQYNLNHNSNEDLTFITNNIVQSHNKPKMIDKNIIQSNGIRYPYKLYIMNVARSKIMTNMMDNSLRSKSFDLYGDNQQQHFKLIKKQHESIHELNVQSNEKQKKLKEYLSRKPLDNAYYALRALNRKSQAKVVKQYHQLLPSDSRFHNL